jgi:hypothetical protein
VKALTSPAGAILAIVCFFLPWARISCAPVVNKTVSGATLGGAFWLVPVLAAAVVALFLVSKRIGGFARAWPIIILAPVAALAIIAIQSLRLASQTRFGIGSDDVGFSLRAGSVGTVAGLLVALAGGLLLKPRRSRRPGASNRG